MDELSDLIHQLSRELDSLDAESTKYQVEEGLLLRICGLFFLVITCISIFQGVADEYNRLKDLKRVSGHSVFFIVLNNFCQAINNKKKTDTNLQFNH